MGINKNHTFCSKNIIFPKALLPPLPWRWCYLVASAHALAAAGGNGMLEVHFNNNPLRSLIVNPMLDKSSGSMKLGNGHGLGLEFDFKHIEEFRIL